MKKTVDAIVIIVMFWLGVLGLIALIFSCSAVNRVNKSEAKQLKVIQNYVKRHPFKNDTLLVVRPGDTVTLVTEKLDTLYIPELESDTLIKPIYITKTIKVTKTIRDTIERKIIDRKLLSAMQDAVENANKTILENNAQISELKSRLNIWRTRFFALLSLNIIVIFLRIYLFFKR